MAERRAADPDVIVAVEVDAKWDAALARGLAADYPHHLRRPLDNYYGMAIYSRLAFEGVPEVRFVVQDDVPSARLTLRLRDGQRVPLARPAPPPAGTGPATRIRPRATPNSSWWARRSASMSATSPSSCAAT